MPVRTIPRTLPPALPPVGGAGTQRFTADPPAIFGGAGDVQLRINENAASFALEIGDNVNVFTPRLEFFSADHANAHDWIFYDGDGTTVTLRWDESDDSFEFTKAVDLAKALTFRDLDGAATIIGIRRNQGISLDIGRMDGTNATPFIDFHGGDDGARNSRIISKGNQSGASGGTLELDAALHQLVGDGDANRSYAGNVGTYVNRVASNQVLVNATWTFALWNSDLNDDKDWHSVSTNTERIVVDRAGWYMVAATIDWTGVVAGDRCIARLMFNTTVPSAGVTNEIARVDDDSASAVFIQNITGVVKLTAGDHLEVVVWTENNADIRINSSRFAVARMF